MQLPQRVARRHLEKHVSDPELRARLMPDYSFGCKRVLPSNEWYPAITQPNVERGHRRASARCGRTASWTADGELHEVDTIVFATGFYVTDVRFAKIVRGRDGALDVGRLERQPAGLPGHRGRRVPEPLHHHRARTPASATTRSCT